eukprot:tig00000227_g19829.t1
MSSAALPCIPEEVSRAALLQSKRAALGEAEGASARAKLQRLQPDRSGAAPVDAPDLRDTTGRFVAPEGLEHHKSSCHRLHVGGWAHRPFASGIRRFRSAEIAETVPTAQQKPPGRRGSQQKSGTGAAGQYSGSPAAVVPAQLSAPTSAVVIKGYDLASA